MPNDTIDPTNPSSRSVSSDCSNSNGSSQSDQWIAGLVAKLQDAMPASNDNERCDNIKAALMEQIGTGECPLDSALLEAVAAQYGRRLLYRDPAGAFTVVLMIWGAGQGTPMHDHAGLWCVDCVCLGNITVESYEPQPARTDGSGLLDFEKVLTVEAGIGEAGALIPPFEYHTIHNHHDKTAATVHVYGGELTECNIFVPEGSGYRMEVMPLGYCD